MSTCLLCNKPNPDDAWDWSRSILVHSSCKRCLESNIPITYKTALKIFDQIEMSALGDCSTSDLKHKQFREDFMSQFNSDEIPIDNLQKVEAAVKLAGSLCSFNKPSAPAGGAGAGDLITSSALANQAPKANTIAAATPAIETKKTVATLSITLFPLNKRESKTPDAEKTALRFRVSPDNIARRRASARKALAHLYKT